MMDHFPAVLEFFFATAPAMLGWLLAAGFAWGLFKLLQMYTEVVLKVARGVIGSSATLDGIAQQINLSLAEQSRRARNLERALDALRADTTAIREALEEKGK